jgi:hypothetical protein
MHAVQLLHKIVKKSCVGIHSKRLDGLFVAVDTLAMNGKLSVTGLGRSLKNETTHKHNIKRIDRLVGNEKLYGECAALYSTAAQWIIHNKKRIPLLIDWSWLPGSKLCVLRASVPTQGRALTIYEEVHPKKKNNNHNVHKTFLQKLKTIIPQGCIPVTITDAGFHSPFFKEVEKLGWDWVGRIRNLTKHRKLKTENWISCKELHNKATKIPHLFSEVILSKSTPIQCSIFLYKGQKKGRIAKNKLGKRRKAKASKICANAGREPWVLATSLKGGNKIAKKVVKLYKSRMQIEEGFRDLKSSRLGLSLEDSQTYKQKRFTILLLIGMLAILALFLLGKAGEQQEMQYQFQANTVRKETVLSVFYLGCQISREGKIKFNESELLAALKAIRVLLTQWEVE